MKNITVAITLILCSLSIAFPANAATYIGSSATLPISVKIVANCNVQPERWCSERKRCCDRVSVVNASATSVEVDIKKNRARK